MTHWRRSSPTTVRRTQAGGSTDATRPGGPARQTSHSAWTPEVLMLVDLRRRRAAPDWETRHIGKYVLIFLLTMKDVYNYDRDPDGSLYDPRVRAAMTGFAGGDRDDLLAFEAGAAVRTAYHSVERMRAHGSQGRGVSAGALDLLIRLNGGDQGISIGDLARAAGVSSRNVTGLVDTLENDGLVRRVPDPDDRRSVLAEITPAGRAWIEAFREPSRLAMRAMFQGFSPEELVAFRDLCLRLAANQSRILSRLGHDSLPRTGQQP
ncbi:MarR family transcriptional regulator [Nonomuraea sp. NPDC050691]|uniref:MarR family winged helix-turn-helix transcriptional regulator n=1 Tax=Nonomuraea sp. NPDC050691 TaxID=3155661 RepID=UPI0033C82DA3